MPGNPKDWFLVRKWRQLTGGWAPYVEDAIPAPDLAVEMRQASIPSFGFFFMLALAGAIATFGLIADSAPAIIGAMIIAPLMAPIISLSYGLVAFERSLISRSILTVAAGVILVVALAYLTTRLFGLRIAGPEILSRTSPTLIDLGVAVAAGGAAAFAHTRRSIISSIAGVAIAVALVPPLAVSGIGAAMGGKATAEVGLSLGEIGHFYGGRDIALGAFLLFLTNLVGIVGIAILVFVSHRYGEWKKALVALLLFVGLSAFLIPPLKRELYEIYVEDRVVRLFAKLAVARPDIMSGRAVFQSVHATYREGLLHVNVDGFYPKDLSEDLEERVELFREYLSTDLGEPVVVELDVIVADIVHIRSELPARQAAEQQADEEDD